MIKNELRQKEELYMRSLNGKRKNKRKRLIFKQRRLN